MLLRQVHGRMRCGVGSFQLITTEYVPWFDSIKL